MLPNGKQTNTTEYFIIQEYTIPFLYSTLLYKHVLYSFAVVICASQQISQFLNYTVALHACKTLFGVFPKNYTEAVGTTAEGECNRETSSTTLQLIPPAVAV